LAFNIKLGVDVGHLGDAATVLHYSASVFLANKPTKQRVDLTTCLANYLLQMPGK